MSVGNQHVKSPVLILSSHVLFRSESSLSISLISRQADVLTCSPVALNTCEVNGCAPRRPPAVNSCTVSAVRWRVNNALTA